MAGIFRNFFLKISVIIPTCNRNELLGLCLDRVAPGAQTLAFDEYEVIVTDDGLHYEAETFCKNHYTWVRYIRGPKKGPAANRNNGARHAGSSWLVFLDDDCLPNTDLLQVYATAIVNNPEAKILEGVILPEGPKPNALAFAPIKEVRGFLWSCNFSISTATFWSVDGFDEKFKYAHMEDKDLQVRLESAGNILQFVPCAAVIHPWRTLSKGKTLAIREESFVYYCAKHQIVFRPFVFVKKLFFFYFSRVREKWSLKDAFYLFCQYLVHLSVFFSNYPAWKRKYFTQ